MLGYGVKEGRVGRTIATLVESYFQAVILHFNTLCWPPPELHADATGAAAAAVAARPGHSACVFSWCWCCGGCSVLFTTDFSVIIGETGIKTVQKCD